MSEVKKNLGNPEPARCPHILNLNEINELVYFPPTGTGFCYTFAIQEKNYNIYFFILIVILSLEEKQFMKSLSQPLPV